MFHVWMTQLLLDGQILHHIPDNSGKASPFASLHFPVEVKLELHSWYNKLYSEGKKKKTWTAAIVWLQEYLASASVHACGFCACILI